MNHRKIRGLRWVRRFNFHRCNHYQSVAEHSYFVALLAWSVCMFTGEDQATILRHALLHDATEAITGDVPFLVRRSFNMELLDRAAAAELGIPPDVPLAEVRLADAIELKMYLEEESRSGNGGLSEIERETHTRIRALVQECGLDRNEEFLEWLGGLIRWVPPKPLPEGLVHGDND